MKDHQVTDWISTLAVEWMDSELRAGSLDLSACCRTLSWLYLSVGDMAETAAITRAVTKQAKKTGESSEWVVRELAFEASLSAKSERFQLAKLHLARDPDNPVVRNLFHNRLNRFIQLVE